MKMEARGSAIGWFVSVALIGFLLGAAAYVHAITVGWVGVDSDLPGSGPTSELARYAAATLFFGGLVFVLAAAVRPTAAALATPLLPFVGFAAVLYAAARYRSYDPYFFPQLYRVSAVSDVPAWTLGVLAVIALGACLVAWRRPRAGLLLEGLTLWVVLVWLFFVGPLH